MSVPFTVHCSNCGGQNVKRDAHAEWNPELQLWELSAVYDDWDCDDCGHSVSVYEKTVSDPSERRFNNLGDDQTLDHFEWFELVACRRDESDGGIVQCEAGSAEFWGIYGRSDEGTGAAPEYLATAIHDAITPLEAVRIARQIAVETGKGFVAGDTALGHFPTCIDIGLWPVTQFNHIADELKNAIWEDLEITIAPEDRHKDDDDTHPLAELREAFVEFSDYSGSDQRDPYHALETAANDGRDLFEDLTSPSPALDAYSSSSFGGGLFLLAQLRQVRIADPTAVVQVQTRFFARAILGDDLERMGQGRVRAHQLHK